MKGSLYKKYANGSWCGDGLKKGRPTGRRGARLAWRKNKHSVRARMDREVFEDEK